MAVRIRTNGKILCAAMHPEEKGDVYVHDGIHYILSAEKKYLVTDDDHLIHGEWWWRDEVPENIKISDFYNDKN